MHALIVRCFSGTERKGIICIERRKITDLIGDLLHNAINPAKY